MLRSCEGQLTLLRSCEWSADCAEVTWGSADCAEVMCGSAGCAEVMWGSADFAEVMWRMNRLREVSSSWSWFEPCRLEHLSEPSEVYPYEELKCSILLYIFVPNSFPQQKRSLKFHFLCHSQSTSAPTVDQALCGDWYISIKEMGKDIYHTVIGFCLFFGKVFLRSS